MKKLIFIFVLFAAFSATAQQVEKTTVLYSVKDADSLRMDCYRTAGESLEPAPCLLFVFGGGFVTGQRDAQHYVPFFEYMARRGFMVASIDYRLGLKKALDAGTLNQNTFGETFMGTLVMAVEDLYDATAYILENAAAWNVDPSRIISCGSSAGAITVLHGEYGLCNGNMLSRRLPDEFNYAGVISFAGAIFAIGDDLNWGSKRTPAPTLLFHGDADKNVPYGVIREMGAGFFGSEYISSQLTRMKVPHEFYSVANTDHVVAVSPMNGNRYEIDSFLEKLVFLRRPLIIRTEVTPLDQPDVPKQFSLMDYIQSNFGN